MASLHSERARAPGAASPRLAELAKSAPTALLLYSEGGALLALNEAAAIAFGNASLADLFGSEERAGSILAAVRRHGRVSGEAELATLTGNVWYLVQARDTVDPETGALAVSVAAEDITERRSAERAKDEFISIVNHELRTPLTAIRGAVGLLVNDAVQDPPAKAELFEIAWDNVLRLGRLVDDLLDVQRLRLGAVDLVLTVIELAPLADETLGLLAAAAEEAGVHLLLSEPSPTATVRADSGRIVQALGNLVSNAIKHAPRDSTVTVEVSEREGSVRVSVQDEGSGVPEDFIPRLFAPFSQADSSDIRARGGAGLGLYIVRTLVEAHGGNVGYERPATGGALFYFELPAAHASWPGGAPLEGPSSRRWGTAPAG